MVIVLAAIVVGSIIKAVTGMGLPLIAIPIAALFVDLDDAVVVIAFPNLLANAVLATRERAARPATRDLPVLALFGIVGAIGGALAFVNLPDEPLVVLLIVSIIGYVLVFFVAPDLRIDETTSRRWSPLVGSVAGGFQGAIGISGPVVGSWIHSYRLDRSAHVLSVTVLFFLTGVAQFAVLLVNGELDGRVVATLLACVPVLASIPVGTAIRDRMTSRAFDLSIIVLLVVSALALAIRTFA